MKYSDVALVGLAVMGKNLALNLEEHGYRVVVHNRSREKTDEFMSGEGQNKNFVAAYSPGELVCLLNRPRKIILMVKAGEPVDAIANTLAPFLEEGDIIIDAGNSHFSDTVRRVEAFQKKGIHFVGCGVSGGEEGARHGPSIMPGGSVVAWPHLEKMFTSIAAKANDNSPCCEWVGSSGSGHFVKMVHNGIEYGDMQVVAEAYDVMRRLLGMENDAISQVFETWNRGEMSSYLVEITADILSRKEVGGGYVVDSVLDVAQQKGTGRWTLETSLALGVPLTLIGESVQARALSVQKEEREAASKIFGGSVQKGLSPEVRERLLIALERAVFASKIVSYAQGFSLMSAASKDFGWNLDLGKVAMIWRGGCIIRSRFLGSINAAFKKSPHLSNLMIDPFFAEILKTSEAAWREVVSYSVLQGIPLPTMSSALAYFDGYRSQNLPANLIQAQRDYFGAHTYERVGAPRGVNYHSEWLSTPRGQNVAFSRVD
jgi:6-phosphogluconate dehydrogenase